MAAVPPVKHDDDGEAWPAARTAWYATLLLLIAYTFSFVDRQVLNLLVEPIRKDLGLSDTRISLLQGLGFVATYVLMSVPIGRMVDRFHRVRVLIGGVLVWSAATFYCGLANSFMALLIARLAVGIGEASVTPASWSLMADMFPPHRLARPISIFLMGPYLGGGLALILGAELISWTRGVETLSLPLLGALSTWQFIFVAVALPGVLVAASLATISEPPRRMDPRAKREHGPPSWKDVVAHLLAHGRVYAAVLLGTPFMIVILYGLQAWAPTILVRVYGWDLVEAGRVYGSIALLAGSAGVFCGPTLAGWLSKKGHRDYPLRVALLAAVAIVPGLGSLPWQDAEGALVCIALGSFFVTLPLALMTFALQTVTPNAMRGVVAGIYVVSTNVIGLGLGPTLVAAATDFIFADLRAVAMSLTLVSVIVAPLAALLFASGMRAYREMAPVGA